ncbi:hypothetical protein [Endozoicomonas sp. 2B-B]
MFAVCQAEPWTGRFTVELEQDKDSPGQSFSIKHNQHTSSGNPSDIAHKNGCTRSASPSGEKRQRSGRYEIKSTIIESVSWQWFCAVHLLVAYELLLTTKNNPLNSSPYSWVPSEVVVVVGWLLKNYWNPDSPLFDPIEQQTTSMLTQEDYLSEILITMYGYGQNPTQHQPSEASGKQTPQTTNLPKGSLTNPLYSDTDGGNGGSEQLSHTLSLNCFAHPCNGVCRFRPSTDGKRPAEWTLNYQEISSNCTETHPGQGLYPHFANEHNPSQRQAHQPDDATTLNTDDLVIINGLLNLRNQSCPEESEISFTLSHLTSHAGISKTEQTVTHSSQLDQSSSHISRTDRVQAINNNEQLACGLTIVGENGQPQPCRKICKNVYALSVHKSRYHTGQRACYVMVVGESGLQQQCGKICKNASALSNHKRREHTGKQICGVTVVLEDGRTRLCGTVCKNADTLSTHKRRHKTGQQTCDATVVGRDGQQQPCGKVFKNALALADHKYKYHRGQQTCSMSMVGEDGLSRPCGTVCMNTNSLMNHKRRYHTGQQTCDMTVIGENGQQKCGKVFMNAKALSTHKSACDTRRQTCMLPVTEDGAQPRPCGKVCSNKSKLADHKYKHHSGQQTCYMTVVGEDGLRRHCGTVWKNPNSLMNHKRRQHTSEQTCYVTVIGKDGRQRRCGKVCKNASSLADHKYKYHSGYHTCHMTVVGEDSLPRQCGMALKNANSLTNHKKRYHTGQQICDATLVGENGQMYSCGKLLNNAKALSDHKRIHRKRKPVDADRDKDLNP